MTTYDFVSVPVPSELVSRVMRFMHSLETEKSLNQTIEHFIEYGLENADWKYKDGDDIFQLSPGNELAEGYLWARGDKSLFLPNGTQIMRKYKGKDQLAQVKDKTFVHEKKIFNSPAALARALSGNTSVNAWIVLWIKRPVDTKWRLAADLVEPA